MATTISTNQTTSVSEVANTYQIESGRTHPLGATPDKEGVNFAIFSEKATSVELLLFEKHDDLEPIQIIELNPKTNGT